MDNFWLDLFNPLQRGSMAKKVVQNKCSTENDIHKKQNIALKF